MEQQNHLSEEKYLKNKKMLMRLAIVLLVVGLLIGGGLITGGVITKIKAEEEYNATMDLINQEYENSMDLINKEYESTMQSLGQEEDDMDEMLENFNTIAKNNSLSFDAESKKDSAEFDAKTKKSDAEFDAGRKKNSTEFSGTIMIFAGIFICVASSMWSISLILLAKRREIAAFKVQQMMPVAQEGIDKMAPTVGNAAKEITKGIKDGWNGSNNGQQ